MPGQTKFQLSMAKTLLSRVNASLFTGHNREAKSILKTLKNTLRTQRDNWRSMTPAERTQLLEIEESAWKVETEMKLGSLGMSKARLRKLAIAGRSLGLW